MLITLCYVYLWVRFQKCYSVVIQKTLRRQYAQNNSISFTFSVFNSKPEHDDGRRQPTDKQDIQTCVEEEETMLLQLRDKAVYITKPQVCLDLSRWTVIGSSMVAGMRIDNISFVVEATLGNEIVQPSPQTSNKKVLKWSDYCIPLACSPGPPFKAVAQASVDNFGRLGVAFMEDRLQLDNGLMPSKIVSVILQESTLNTLLKRQPPHGHGGAISPPPNNSQTLKPFAESAPFNRLVEDQQKKCRKGSLLPVPEALRRLEERRGSEPLGGARDRGSTTGREDPSSASHDHPEGHGHHLHLASCHECLELENSTILSVKYTSAENIPNLPHDDSACSDGGENLNGFEDDAEGRASGDVEVGGKPPNVLVYTGGRQERYRVVKQLLTECIDMDRYVVYPLQPQQALSDPWLQSTRLLVLAEEEPLAPQLQARFLGYLHQGGRVLGLSSSLCPAGLSLEAGAARRGRVERLSFTREDSTEVELSVMASGSVFARDTGGGGEVELWGELKQDAPQGHSDMVIIRITHGDDEGEAVLCQVHLEMAANREDVTAEGVDELKASDALRYEVLTEILTSLGLSCHLNQAPAPAPVYLLSASQEGKASFLKWLNGHAGDDGRLKLPKASLRVTTHAQLRDGPAPDEGSLALVPDPPPSLSLEHFDLETYRKHLRTRTLGRTVLFSDVIPTTMDLLEG